MRNIDQASKLKNQATSPNSNVLHSLSNSFNNSIYRQLSIRKKTNKLTKNESRPDINEEHQEDQQISLIQTKQKKLHQQNNNSSPAISVNSSSTASSVPFEEIAASTSLLKATKCKTSAKKNTEGDDDDNNEENMANHPKIESKRTEILFNNLNYPADISSFQSFSTYSSAVLLTDYDKVKKSASILGDLDKEAQISASNPNFVAKCKSKHLFVQISKDTLNKTSYDLNMSIESLYSPIVNQTEASLILDDKKDFKFLNKKNVILLKRTSSLNT